MEWCHRRTCEESDVSVTCSGCGLVSSAVASDTRGPRFESNHLQNLYWTLFSVNCIEKDENKEKEDEKGKFLMWPEDQIFGNFQKWKLAQQHTNCAKVSWKLCYKPAKVMEFRQIWSHWMCRNHNTPSVISSSLNAKMIFDFLKQILSHDFAWSDK